MVHALREAHRVLKGEGLLIDLRPAAVHRRAGITEGSAYRLRWVMRETFDDDLAANRAVTHVVREGWFKAAGRTRFPCYRVFDTLDEFQEWLTDFVKRGKCEPHDWLVRRVEREFILHGGKPGIVVSAPLDLRLLKKHCFAP
jgi:hypothetical protein